MRFSVMLLAVVLALGSLVGCAPTVLRPGISKVGFDGTGTVVEKSVVEGEFRMTYSEHIEVWKRNGMKGERPKNRRRHRWVHDVRYEVIVDFSSHADFYHLSEVEWEFCDVGDEIDFDKDSGVYICS